MFLAVWILSHGFFNYYSRAFRMAASFQRVTPKGVVVPEPGEDINEDNKKGDPTTGGGGGTEGGIPVPGNTIEG